jgi:uncharacterized protein
MQYPLTSPRDRLNIATAERIAGRPHEALLIVTEIAATGDARALNNLAIHHHKGQGVPKDPAKATALLQQAADLGLPQAHFNLGIQHFKEGTPTAESVVHFATAAHLGHAKAQYQMGHVAYNGEGGYERNKPAALGFLKQAAQQGHAAAKDFILYMHLQEDAGLQRHDPAALATAKELAPQGYSKSKAYLVCDYIYNGAQNITRAEALQHSRDLAKKGLAQDLFLLARVYNEGETPASGKAAILLQLAKAKVDLAKEPNLHARIHAKTAKLTPPERGWGARGAKRIEERLKRRGII